MMDGQAEVAGTEVALRTSLGVCMEHVFEGGWSPGYPYPGASLETTAPPDAASLEMNHGKVQSSEAK